MSSEAFVGGYRGHTLARGYRKLVGKADHVRRRVVERDEQVRLRKGLVQSLAHQLGDRFLVELLFEGLADLFDDRQPRFQLGDARARVPVFGGESVFGLGTVVVIGRPRIANAATYTRPRMEYAESIIDLIGNTPLVRLTRVTRDLGPAGRQPLILAKLEMLNPGGSVKDRIGLPMIEAAERDGLLKKGGTIIEPTSGNTGHGLAIAAALKGYRCIFVMADKQSAEKQSLLRAYGAEVVLCPTNVEPESPESYYSVAKRLARDIPGAFQPDQYWNQNNPEAHYRTTGPEIWRQTEGKVTHVVIASGTGGTITGTGRYLKEQNAEVVHGRR